MAYAPVYPHGNVEEIGNDIYIVRGSIKMNPVIRITRNMVVVRHEGELTLIDPIRVNATGENQLAALGKIKHIVRLGAFHGIDDPYYVDHFKAKLWSQPGGKTYREPPIDNELTDTTELPIPNAELMFFNGTNEPECAILIKDGDGLLVTCDAIQNYGDYSYNNFPAKILLPILGISKTTVVGPVWLKVMTPEGGNLKSEFKRLLEFKFDRLVAAHGTYLGSGAYAAVGKAIDDAFTTK
jgi:hypothetical protein